MENRLDNCENLVDYLHAFKAEISARVQEEAHPLHNPATDPVDSSLTELLRQPYPAQAHAITATLKTLAHEPAAFVVGEMGTGKTLIGGAIAWLLNKLTRTLIMCPGHLVEKWAREIRITIPNSEPRIIRDLPGAIQAAYAPRTGKAQFWILSKETAKLEYAKRPGVNVKEIARQAYDQKTETYYTVVDKLCFCPQCGHKVEKKPAADGDLPTPIDFNRLKKHPRKRCPKCSAERKYRGPKTKHEPRAPYWQSLPKVETPGGKLLTRRPTNSPLWTANCKPAGEDKKPFTGTKPYQPPAGPRKIGIADYFHRQGARFDCFIADEVHELKGSDTEQGNALGTFSGCADKTLCLTGTLIGGYSTHLFYLLYRSDPQAMKRAGFKYGKTDPWIDRYGIRETVIVETTRTDGSTCVHGRGSTTGSRTGSNERPGISPALFAERLLNNSVFLHLEDVSAGLPPLTETPVEVEMSPEQAKAYKRLESDIKSVMDRQLAQGNKQLLGRYLTNLLSYADKPFENAPVDLGDGSFAIPEELDQTVEYPKESKMVEIAREARNRGRKSLIFLNYTGKRDTAPRLKKALTDYGLRAEILYASTVKPINREAWILEHQDALDCLIVNPECVKTGLDLIAFETVIYIQTGYNVFTLRQSSRRSWRIGQNEPVEIHYLYYKDTMQARAIALVGKKLNASQAIEGKLTNEGLQALAGDDDDEAIALARALCEGGLTDGIESTWNTLNQAHAARFKTEHKEPEPSAELAEIEAQFTPEELEKLESTFDAAVSQTIIENPDMADELITHLYTEPMYPETDPEPTERDKFLAELDNAERDYIEEPASATFTAQPTRPPQATTPESRIITTRDALTGDISHSVNLDTGETWTPEPTATTDTKQAIPESASTENTVVNQPTPQPQEHKEVKQTTPIKKQKQSQTKTDMIAEAERFRLSCQETRARALAAGHTLNDEPRRLTIGDKRPELQKQTRTRKQDDDQLTMFG